MAVHCYVFLFYTCLLFSIIECGTFRYLEIAPKDELHLWRSTIFPNVLVDFSLFFHDIKERGSMFGVPPINTDGIK